MDHSIIVALITILGTVIVFALSKYHEIATEWKKEKLAHYKVLLSSLSDVAGGKTNANFALAFNTITLVAPQAVIEALIQSEMEPHSAEEHEKLFNKLILEIRKDIGLAKRDNSKTFNFYFIGKKTKP